MSKSSKGNSKRLLMLGGTAARKRRKLLKPIRLPLLLRKCDSLARKTKKPNK